MHYDSTKFYYQSGVIPFLFEKGRLRILLITSRSGKRWVLPKGLIEPGLSAVESAEKEAFEEAGIKGKVYRKPLGRYRYWKWNGVCQMTVLPMEVKGLLKSWPECNFRKRRWVSLKKFTNLLDERVPRKIFRDMVLFVMDTKAAQK